MSSLLHIDTSFRRTGSVTRELSGYFAAQWREQHPAGDYSHRDLAAQPVPHITDAVHEAIIDPSGEYGEPSQELALTRALTVELREATTLLIGLPMYNYSIPSTFKTWLDRIVTPAHILPPESDTGLLSGKHVVVVTARGGSYAPGTPREGWDYQEPYLRAVLGAIGLADDLNFVHAELTLAATAPALGHLKSSAEQSLASAYEALRTAVEGC